MTSLELQNQGRAEGLFTLITLHLGCCLFGQDRVISPMGMVQEGPSALASRAQSCSLGASSFSRPEILGLAWYLDGASGWGGVSSGIWVRGADDNSNYCHVALCLSMFGYELKCLDLPSIFEA